MRSGESIDLCDEVWCGKDVSTCGGVPETLRDIGHLVAGSGVGNVTEIPCAVCTVDVQTFVLWDINAGRFWSD